MANKFRFFITDILLTDQEVFPLGASELRETFEPYSGNVADYKRGLKNPLVFRGTDYNHFNALETSSSRCNAVDIRIQKLCGGVYSDWFFGKLNLSKANWDHESCLVSFPVDIVDQYYCLEQVIKDEIDLFQIVGDRVTTKLMPPNSALEFVDYVDTVIRTPFKFWGGSGTPATGGWVLYKHTYQDNGTSWENHTYWVRVKRTEPCANPDLLSPWIFIQDLCPATGKIYAMPAALYGKELLQNYNNAGLLITYVETWKIVGENTANAIQNVDNGMLWRDVIQALVAPCSLLVKSDFFQINPDNASANNYVTGILTKVANLIMYQKSDVKRPRDINNATICKTTREEILGAMCTFFNLQWKISSGIFRIEHVSYFNKATGIDTTLANYSRYINRKHKYSYDNTKMPSREVFKAQEASLVSDFEDANIYYSTDCSTKGDEGKREYTTKNMTTDLLLCLNNPDSTAKLVDDAGIFLMATDEYLGEYYVITEPALRYYIAPNNPLAWCQLLRDYHKHARPFKSGNMNGVDTTFISVIPTKKQEPITIPLACGEPFNPNDKVQTILGLGEVANATYSLDSCKLELSLMYAMDENLIINHAPVANPDGATTFKNVPIDIDVMANDSDPEGMATIDLLEITTAPTTGTAVVLSDKRIRYTPAAGLTGDFSFYYRIKDNTGLFSNVALVVVSVVDPAPQAIADTYSIVKSTSRNMLSVLGNDLKGETAASIQVISNSSPSTRGVAISVNPDGTFFYAAPSTAGADSFTYTIENNLGYQHTGTVTINVTEPPVIHTFVFSRSLVSGAEACTRYANPANRLNYYSDSATLIVGSRLYTDTGLAVTAYFGWYSNGAQVYRIVATDGIITQITSC